MVDSRATKAVMAKEIMVVAETGGLLSERAVEVDTDVRMSMVGTGEMVVVVDTAAVEMEVEIEAAMAAEIGKREIKEKLIEAMMAEGQASEVIEDMKRMAMMTETEVVNTAMVAVDGIRGAEAEGHHSILLRPESEIMEGLAEETMTPQGMMAQEVEMTTEMTTIHRTMEVEEQAEEAEIPGKMKEEMTMTQEMSVADLEVPQITEQANLEVPEDLEQA
jgi:hypothetical protein